VGKAPAGVTFDGTNIWVANEDSNNVMKLRASDGAVLGAFNVGMEPGMVAYDGANIWVTNGRGESVSKLKK
jgi:DNA-binding beta-propeller fold protein YncE